MKYKLYIKESPLGLKYLGKHKSLKGQTLSAETKRKMSESGKVKIFTAEHRKKLSESQKGQKRSPYSEDHRKKISASHKGKKQQIIKCPYCNKEGGNATMPRWHFDNCKKII